MASYQCYTCEKRKFKSQEGVKSHCKAMGHYPTWDCDQCSDQLDNKEELQKHKKGTYCPSYHNYWHKHFVKTALPGQHLKTSPHNSHRCDQCRQNFASSSALQQHHDCSPTHQIICPHCSKSFRHECSLQSLGKSTFKYPCSQCNAVLPSVKDLKVHIMDAHAFKCDYCTITFQCSESREAHKDLAHKFACMRCTVSFKTETDLKNHFTDRHPLVCFRCCTSCSGKSALEDHLKLHTHKCKTCSKEFPTLERLLDHQCLLQRPKCPQCTQTFCSPATFIEHYKSAHMEEETPNGTASSVITSSALLDQPTTKTTSKNMSTQTTKYRCEQCDENFNDDEEFQRHEQHSPFHHDKILECYECNLKFKSQIGLLEHIDSKPHSSRWVLVLI